MFDHKSRTFGRLRPIFWGSLAAWLSILTLAEPARAIPVFARKYRTSCITCHAGFPKLNSVGEAFRRHGYQFPADEEILVKDEPIPMGNEAYREMWPNSIWPSDIPHLPPVALRARMGYKQFLNTPAAATSTDFQFPMDYSLLSAGTFGENISWYAGMVLAGKGGHGGGGGHGAAEGLEPELERLFVQFSNLFAWSAYEDDNGMREGNRWLTLPPHAMNLRVGQFDPGVVAPWASIHRQWGVAGRLPNVVSLGDSHFENDIQNMNPFMLEPAMRGLELHGIVRQYNSYAVGMVNGNGTMASAWDNNANKDFYFRVARKWFGFPLDGVLGEAPAPEDGDLAADEEIDDDAMGPPTMDFWREIQFETGFFGYFGQNTVMVQREFEDEGIDGTDFEVVHTVAMLTDKFERVGVDARVQFQDLDLFGMCYWGWNEAPGAELEDGELEVFSDIGLFTWFLEADYFIKPWLTTYLRYEELSFDSGHFQRHKGIERAVAGVVFTVRANMRIVGEFVIDAKGPADGEYTTNDHFTLLLDFAY